MGHYLACRYYGVDATLPFFIPVPASWREPRGHPRRLHPDPRPHPAPPRALRHRRRRPARRASSSAFPCSGSASARPRVRARSPADAGGIFLGEPLALPVGRRASSTARSPTTGPCVIGPLGLAAWFGLFVTALNLMPDRPARRRPRDLRAAPRAARRSSRGSAPGSAWRSSTSARSGSSGRSSSASSAGATPRPSTTTSRSAAARVVGGRSSASRSSRLLRARPDHVLVAGLLRGDGADRCCGSIDDCTGRASAGSTRTLHHASGSTSTAMPGQRCGP